MSCLFKAEAAVRFPSSRLIPIAAHIKSERSCWLSFYVDKDGLPVDAKYLRLDVRDITVSLGIYTDKIVQLAVETAPGFPSEYYRGAMISPISVTLRGDPKLVEGIDKLVVLTLTTDAKDRYTVKLTDSLLPAGVSFVDAPENVDISLSFAEKPADTEPADEDMP